jgi:hypothetical protein
VFSVTPVRFAALAALASVGLLVVGLNDGAGHAASGEPGRVRASDAGFFVRVESRSRATVTLRWTPVRGGRGYAFFRDGTFLSRTSDPRRQRATFSLPPQGRHLFEVQVLGKSLSARVFVGRNGAGCFSSPGACGYPDPAYGNVGVPAGTTLTPSRTMTVNTDGTVINGMDVTGYINVEATNVMIENTRVTMTGGGCGPSTTCGNSDIRVSCACNVTISHVELTADSGTTVEHAIRNSDGGHITVEYVYQHGPVDALCYCGASDIHDNYSIISLAIADDHLENIYVPGEETVSIVHNTLLNKYPQTANILANTADGGGGPCANNLTITGNLLAGGGYTIYPCASANSVGSSTLDFENNRIARCGGGVEAGVVANGGELLCADAWNNGNPVFPYLSSDGKGWYARGGSFGVDAYSYCGSPGWIWSGNVWDDDGTTVSC